MFRKIFILTLGALTAFAVMAGCSSGADTGKQSAAAAGTASGDAIFGQITAVSGNEITVALVSQQMPQMNSNDGSAQQAAPPSDGGEAPSGHPPEMPSGEMPSDMPSGQPQGDGKGGGFELTGEEKTVTVSDSTVITIRSFDESSEGSLSDLAVGDIVTVTLDGDTVKEISVMRIGRGNAPAQNGESAQSAAPSAS